MNIHDYRLIFANADGSVAVVIPVRPLRPAETDEEYLAELGAHGPDGAVHVATVLASDLPVDRGAVVAVEDDGSGAPGYIPHPDQVRASRAAWRWDSAAGKVVIDAAAKQAARWAQVRAVRGRLLAKSDVDIQVAQETANTQKADALLVYRQALRDIPQTHPDPDAVTWPPKPV